MERPAITIKPTIADHVLEAAAILMLLALWCIVIFGYLNLPETIPIHFNGAGEPDGYGGKGTLILMPAIATVMYFVLTLVNRNPHSFNYPVTITEENAEKQYRIATRMIRTVKLSVMVLFCAIEWGSYKVAMGQQDGLGRYFILFVLGIIFIPMVFFLFKAFRNG